MTSTTANGCIASTRGGKSSQMPRVCNPFVCRPRKPLNLGTKSKATARELACLAPLCFSTTSETKYVEQPPSAAPSRDSRGGCPTSFRVWPGYPFPAQAGGIEVSMRTPSRAHLAGNQGNALNWAEVQMDRAGRGCLVHGGGQDDTPIRRAGKRVTGEFGPGLPGGRAGVADRRRPGPEVLDQRLASVGSDWSRISAVC